MTDDGDKNGPGSGRLNAVLLPKMQFGNEAEIDTVVGKLSRTHGIDDSAAARQARPRPQRGPREKSPVSDRIEIPYPGEAVAWNNNFRAEIPTYVFRQLAIYSSYEGCTLVSLLLNMAAQFEDGSGNKPFRVRPEDLVKDRRKAADKER